MYSTRAARPFSLGVCTSGNTCARVRDLQRKRRGCGKMYSPFSTCHVCANCEQTCNEEREYDLSTHAMQRKLRGKHGGKTGLYLHRRELARGSACIFRREKKTQPKKELGFAQPGRKCRTRSETSGRNSRRFARREMYDSRRRVPCANPPDF